MSRLRFAVFLVVVVLACAAPSRAADEKGTVTGRVVNTHGKAIADANVVATSDGDVETKTNVKGEFSIELPPGSYRLRFEADGYASTTLRLPVSVEAGKTTKLDSRVELPEVDDDSVIRGSVFDTVGRTLAGIRVNLERMPGEDGQPVKPLKRDTHSDSNGFFVFHLPAGEGRYKLTATSARHEPATIIVNVAGGEILNAPPLTLSPR